MGTWLNPKCIKPVRSQILSKVVEVVMAVETQRLGEGMVKDRPATRCPHVHWLAYSQSHAVSLTQTQTDIARTHQITDVLQVRKHLSFLLHHRVGVPLQT